jgi:hypothetical protein
MKNEMGGVGSTYGQQDRLTQDFGGEILRERGHLGDRDIDRKIILK